MATLNVTTLYSESSSWDYFWYAYTLVPCRTTLANLGPLPNYTVPSTCQSTPIFSDVRVPAYITFSACADPMAYRSCMPTPSPATIYTADVLPECEQTFTFHSPAWACPMGWTAGALFTLEPEEGDDRRITTSWSTGQGMPASRLPAVLGTHRLCCPSSYEFTGGSSYGCQSTGAVSSLGNTTLCSRSCDSENTADCMTNTTRIAAVPTSAAALATYAVEAIYLIGDGPPQPPQKGMSSKQKVAVAVAVSLIGGFGLVVFALVFMRRRYRRRREEESKRDIELPSYSRRDPLADGRADTVSSRRDRSDSPSLHSSQHADERGGQSESGDPPPAYNDPQVWEGDGRRG